MHQFTTTELAAIGTFLVTVASVVTALINKLVDNWVKVRKRKMEDRFDVQKIDLLEDKQLQDGLKFAIKKQDRQITELQKQVSNLTLELLNCVREHATAQASRDSLQEQFDQTLAKLELYRRELFKYTHDIPSPTDHFPRLEGEAE